MWRKRPGKAQAAVVVDWRALPTEIVQLVGCLLSRSDLKRACESCKAWRPALLTLRLDNVRVYLAELLGDGPPKSRTRGGCPQCLKLQDLLSHATAPISTTLVISELKWPSDAQLSSALAAFAQQPLVRSLHLQVIEQVSGGISKVLCSALVSRLRRFCIGLAVEAPHVASLKFTTSAEHLVDHSSLLQALAQLSSLQELSYAAGKAWWSRPESIPSIAQLSALTSLTRLTSLEVADIMDEQQPAQAALQQLMGILAQMTQLQSVKLDVRTGYSPTDIHLEVPALPSLKHLHFSTSRVHAILQLSAQLCAQLDSLSCNEFQPAAGVTSMGQLTRLEVHKLPQLQLQQQQQQQQQAAAPVSPPLHLPKLQHAQCSAADQLALLQGLATWAPAIEELDLSSMCVMGAAQVQLLSQTLAQLPPLRSLDVPFTYGSSQAGNVSGWMPQQQQLHSLTLSNSIADQQLPLLQACSRLRNLNLQGCSRTATLHHLPSQLTALTFYGNSSSLCPGKVSKAQLPPLERLVVQDMEGVLRLLPLAQMTGLTCLRARSSTRHSVGPSISRLAQLVELQAAPWPGVASDLAVLRQLRQLELRVPPSSTALLQQEGSQLGGLTQLRELQVVSVKCEDGIVLGKQQHQQQRQVALGLMRALPHCLVQLRG